MNTNAQERFEEWADEAGLSLDQIFMSTDGVPENPYEDADTRSAYEIWRCAWRAAYDEERERLDGPIPMVLHCPSCGLRHVDAPEPEIGWHNPPHRSHRCREANGGCGIVWRPADVPTTGVRAVATRGKADTWPAEVER